MLVEEAIQGGERWAIERFFPPEELKELEYWGIFPEGDDRLRPFHNKESVVIGINSVLTNAEEPHGQPLDDKIDPLSLSPESPLYTLASFPLIRRLFSVGRLGLSRGAPFINWPSRGQHAIQVGLEGLKFGIKKGWPRRDQLLAVIAGFTHDPTPAFGDAAQKALGIKEPDIVGEYFRGDNQEFWESWLREIDKHFGIKFTYQNTKDFIERVVKREEGSLPGLITHGPSRDCLDLDFWEYTVEDVRGVVQAVIMPDARFDLETHPLTQVSGPSFAERMVQLRAGLLDFDNLEDLGRSGRLPESVWIYFQEVDIRPYLEIIDGQLVVTNPTIFRNLAQLAAVLYEGHYYHPNTLGPELMFAQEIKANRDIHPTLEEFSTLTDAELADRLRGTPAGKWLKGGMHHGWRMVEGKNDGRFPGDRSVEGIYPPVNLRLSTLVRDQSGRVGLWKELFPDEAKPLVVLEERSGQAITLVKYG